MDRGELQEGKLQKGENLGDERVMFKVDFGEGNIWQMLEKAQGDIRQEGGKVVGNLIYKARKLGTFPISSKNPYPFLFPPKDVKSVPSSPSFTAHGPAQVGHSSPITTPVSPLATWPAVTPPPSHFSHGSQWDIANIQT